MNKKTSLSIALSAVLGSSSIASADIIEFTYSGYFSIADPNGKLLPNSDAILIPDYVGEYTEITGYGVYDTDSGTGSHMVDPVSFFGSGPLYANGYSFSAIGDGMGGTGSLTSTVFHFDWYYSGALYEWEQSTPMIQDASGFLTNLPSPGQTVTIGSGCTGCATSTTPDGLFVSMGAVPIAMTNFESAFPLVSGSISGILLNDQTPLPGYYMGMDFTSITATNVSAVPIPSAVWLFGSGLLGLVGLARRKANA